MMPEKEKIDWHHNIDGPGCVECQTPIISRAGRLVEGHVFLCLYCSTWLVVEDETLKRLVDLESLIVDDESRARVREFERQAKAFRVRTFH